MSEALKNASFLLLGTFAVILLIIFFLVLTKPGKEDKSAMAAFRRKTAAWFRLQWQNSKRRRHEKRTAKETDEDKPDQSTLRHRKRTTTFWTVVITAFAVLSGLSLPFAADTTFTLFGATLPINWGRLCWITLALYFVFSYKIVPESMVGVKVILGIPLQHLTSGPTWVPLLIGRLVLFPGTLQQDELPADPEHIFRSEDKEVVPEGKFPPNRITFAKRDGSTDPLDKRITAEVPLVVAWEIVDGVNFLKRLGANASEALTEARRQMNDTGIVAATSYFGKSKTAGEAIGDLAEASKIVKEAIDKETDSWGINIPRAEIKSINLNHGLNKSMAAVPASAYDVETQANKGEAVKQFAEKSGVTPQDTLAVEVAKAFAAGENTTIIAGAEGMSSILGMAAAAAKSFAKKDDETK